MKKKLNNLTTEDLLSFKKGLIDMLTGYVTALEDINKEEKENVLYTFVQLSKQIDDVIEQ